MSDVSDTATDGDAPDTAVPSCSPSLAWQISEHRYNLRSCLASSNSNNNNNANIMANTNNPNSYNNYIKKNTASNKNNVHKNIQNTNNANNNTNKNTKNNININVNHFSCNNAMEEMVPPSSSTRSEVIRDEDPNLSTAAEISDCSLSNAPNVDTVEIWPTRPYKPPPIIAEGITNVIELLDSLTAQMQWW
ncbi:GH23461 [Drosophila grimshawi]|uniref:GH23461 n=1 Tax=Drosophila grimshawi TaxID=7222 RepID=B4K0V4_DROGR|nr:GH23461 [Drosophila grimshawi]